MNEAKASSLPHELAQIAVLGREDDRGVALALALREEGGAIGLHRTIEIVECRILVERLRIDLRCLRLRIGADDLRLLQALRLDRRGFLTARRRHPVERAVERRS